MWRLSILLTAATASALAADIIAGPVHLRSGEEREWNEFPAGPAPASLRYTFAAGANSGEFTLAIRQRDVKNPTWTVTLNGRSLGVLASDERDMRTLFPIPAGTLRDGDNDLGVAARSGSVSDDVELSEIQLHSIPREQLLRQSAIHVDTGEEVPVRITIVDDRGVLVPVAAIRNSDREAVRTGVIYTADGWTEFGVPAGDYQVYASRGWDYSAPSARVAAKKDARKRLRLRLKREVNLPGYIGCDTHVHTRELSGHGDTTVRERVITAAGEGLDLIIASEHDRIADYSGTIRRLGLERFIRVIPGTELTTLLGHFNIFPLTAGAALPTNQPVSWGALSESIRAATTAKVVIQNHPRDLHLKYRPFDPAHHLSTAGENLIGRPVFANAMEVINSGAMYSDMMQLVRDWLGLLNRGLRVAAIGASDTHTVDFVPIGQARTLIRSEAINTAAERLADGDNLVSYGLAATLAVNPGKPLLAEVEIHGPSWTSADRLTIFANGLIVADYAIPVSWKAGLKWYRRIPVPASANDVTLVAVASGPGVLQPFWEVRKPYQPVSRDWTPRVMGISRAVRVDLDGGGYQSPREYATKMLDSNDLSALHSYDESVAVQVLSILAGKGQQPESVRAQIPERAYEVFMSDWTRRAQSVDEPGQ